MHNLKSLPQTSAAHNLDAQLALPPAGFLRLPQVLALFPVSRSSWWAGVASGRYPKSVKLSCRTSAWRVADILALMDSIDGGNHEQS